MAKIAYLGLGAMGSPMARHLAAAGHAMTAYNRTRALALVLDEARQMGADFLATRLIDQHFETIEAHGGGRKLPAPHEERA